jgi:hypothetical protein
MKSTLALMSLSLVAVACGNGSSSSSTPTPAGTKKEIVAPKKVTPSKEQKKAPKQADVQADKEAEESKENGGSVVPDDSIFKFDLPIVVQDVQGSYLGERFHGASPDVARSLVIDGMKFTSKVYGLATGTTEAMNLIAVQTDEGSVSFDSEGNVILVVEKSTCDGLAENTQLEAIDGALNFKFFPLDTERTGWLAKVETLPLFATDAFQTGKSACWYTDEKGGLRSHINGY